MKKSFDFSLIKNSLFILLGIKALAVLSLFVLPTNGVEQNNSTVTPLNYESYKLADKFLKVVAKKEVVKTQTIKKIDAMVGVRLKAIYSDTKNAFIIIENNTGKTFFLKKEQKYQDYTLQEIKKEEALFIKNAKTYSLRLNGKNSALQSSLAQNKPKPVIKANKEEDQFVIRKRDLNAYTKNPEAIFKSIQLRERFNNGNIDGFVIKSIRKNSVFDKLGVRAGDILMSFNNIPMTSYAHGFQAFDAVKRASSVKLVLLRHGVTKEIEYEIN